MMNCHAIKPKRYWGDHEATIEFSDLDGDDATQRAVWEKLTALPIGGKDAPISLPVLVRWVYDNEAEGDRPADWRYTVTSVRLMHSEEEITDLMSGGWLESITEKV